MRVFAEDSRLPNTTKQPTSVNDTNIAATNNQTPIDDRRLPLVVRIYGVLILLDGLLSLPRIVYAAALATHRALLGREHVDALDLTVILSACDTILLIALETLLIVFGTLLLRNRRRYAARWTYVLIPLTIADGMFSLALQGFGLNLIGPAIQLAILVVLSIIVDPALLQERRLHRSLKRMDERDNYWDAVRKGTLGRDESGKGYIALDFFNVFWLFVFGSVFGLVVETIYHLVVFGEYQDRTSTLWGPFSCIYGFGAAILTVCLNRLWRKNPVLIFFASALIGGAFEYFVSWFMEVTCGIRSWDYTGKWLSIDGRTSGKFMFFWGVLGLLWIKLILPWLLWLINKIPWKVRYSLTAVCFTLLLVDCTLTIMALDCWYMRLAGVEPDSPVTHWFGQHFDNDYMTHKFPTMHIDPSLVNRV